MKYATTHNKVVNHVRCAHWTAAPKRVIRLALRYDLISGLNMKMRTFYIPLIFIYLISGCSNEKFEDNALSMCVENTLIEIKSSDLSEIKTLICQKVGVKKLTGIESLTNLQGLYLQGNDLSSIESLGYIPSLKIISIAGNKNLHSLKGIEKLVNLEELQANGCDDLIDITDISNLTNLKIFSAMQSNISDISSLMNLENLEEVNISYNNISVIESLGNKTKLNKVYLYRNPIISYEPLLKNKNMMALGVWGADSKHCETFRKIKENLDKQAKLIVSDICAL